MDRRPRVAAIVVNYSTADLTAECVKHIRRQTHPHVDVIVVSNGSSLEEAGRLRQRIPNERIHTTGRNLGFADGLNEGMKCVSALNPDFYWVVTPDAAADPRCLEAMLEAMSGDPRLGICGPLIDADGEWIVGCRLIEPLGFLVRIESVPADSIETLPPIRPTDFVEGCSMLIRAATAREVGLFRLEFFLYYEECDFCLRARDLGWQLAVVTRARVYTRARKQERNARSYYLARNSIVLARLRKRHVVAAVARGLVEAVLRAPLQPRQLITGLKAVRDGLALKTG